MENLKAIEIKGNLYIPVNERLKAFRADYPNWSLESEIVQLDDNACVIRAVIRDENGIIRATGLAQEDRTSSMINKTSYVENCVPRDTQILTKDGWKYWYQLKIGDEVFSLNTETRKNEYCKLTAINLYEKKSLIELKTSRFRAVCTPEHKWLIGNNPKKIQKVATKDLKTCHKIVQAVKQDVEPSVLGKKLGWLMCDCDIKYASGMPSTAYISQSKVKQVKILTELFGEPRKVKKVKENWLQNYEWIVHQKDVLEILGKFDIVTYKDLSRAMAKANIEDVAGCFESVMLADGYKGHFASTYKELVDAVQIMCVRLGIATSFITERMQKNSTKPLYTLGIKSSKNTYVSEISFRNMPPHDVWCPTTENGNWFMRQGSFVTLTSNCETSAWGRALGCLGIGIDTSVASAEEMQMALAKQDNLIAKQKVLGGEYVFKGGKHAGKAIKDTPKDYLEWYAQNGSDEFIKRNIRKFAEEQNADIRKSMQPVEVDI